MTPILRCAAEQIGEGLWKWSAWIETDTLEEIDEVVYTLDPSFFNPVRRIRDRVSRFLLADTTSSAFTLFARIRFIDGRDLRTEVRLPVTPNEPATASGALKRPVILLVEDDEAVLQALLRDLARYRRSFSLRRANSGQEALQILSAAKQAQEQVALIISDERMPGMRGMEYLAIAAQLHPNSKKMLLTAYLDAGVAISGINVCRIDYYLMKPWDPPEEKLYPVLDELLNTWQPTRTV
jgi:CheY-like chemotaxis protein